MDFHLILNEIFSDFNAVFSNPLVLIIITIFALFATYTDIKSLKIYNKANLLFFIFRIILIFIPTYGLAFSFNSLLGGLIGAIILIIPAVALMHKMGGDIKFIFVLGLYLGLPLTIILLIISCASMLIFSLFRKIITKKELRKLLTPFAPFFTFSLFVMYIISMFV